MLPLKLNPGVSSFVIEKLINPTANCVVTNEAIEILCPYVAPTSGSITGAGVSQSCIEILSKNLTYVHIYHLAVEILWIEGDSAYPVIQGAATSSFAYVA